MTLYIRFCASCCCADPTLNRQGRHYALEIKDTSITTPCFHYCPWAPVKMTCFKHVYYIPCTCLVSLLFLVGFLHPELGVLRGKSLQGARLWHVGERQQIQQRQHRAAFQVRQETTSFQICSLPASRSLQHRRERFPRLHGDFFRSVWVCFGVFLSAGNQVLLLFPASPQVGGTNATCAEF